MLLPPSVPGLHSLLENIIMFIICHGTSLPQRRSCIKFSLLIICHVQNDCSKRAAHNISGCCPLSLMGLPLYKSFTHAQIFADKRNLTEFPPFFNRLVLLATCRCAKALLISEY